MFFAPFVLNISSLSAIRYPRFVSPVVNISTHALSAIRYPLSAMLNIRITVTDFGATALLNSLRSPKFDEGVRQVSGKASANTVQKHLRGLDRARPNRLGGTRSHFYSLAALATSFTTDEQGAIVTVAHLGIAQRFYGGTIRPINAKALAIPARAEAYGRRPRDADNPQDLFLRPGKAGRTAALARRQGKRLEIWYWLVKSVTQDPDPTVLPPERDLTDAATTAADNYIRRHLDRARQRIFEERATP